MNAMKTFNIQHPTLKFQVEASQCCISCSMLNFECATLFPFS